MNLHNLRIINTLLFLLAGLIFGLLLRAHRSGKPPGATPAEASAQQTAPAVGAAAGGLAAERPGPAAVPVILPDSGAAAFFQNPDEYMNSELELELKLVDVQKGEGGWRLKMGYLLPGSGIKYVFLDARESMPEVAGLSPGYFYMVRFKCRAGDLASGNHAVSISPARGSGPVAP